MTLRLSFTFSESKSIIGLVKLVVSGGSAGGARMGKLFSNPSTMLDKLLLCNSRPEKHGFEAA